MIDNGEATTLGIERQLAYLAGAQKARGSEVMIMIDREGIFTEACRRHEIPVIVADGLSLDDRQADVADENALQDLIENVKSFNADLIHCHSVRAAWLGVKAGNRMDIPCVFSSDGPMPTIEGRRKGLRFATVCLTGASFEKLKSSMPEVEVYYVPNGTRCVPPTQTWEIGPTRSASLIFAGSLIQRKGVDIAILAMVELRKRRGQDCPILNIYGDGNRRGYLTEMTAVLELDDVVRFHGFKQSVVEHCPSTDILIMPSRNEVAPLVILEAMSRGMPIVATDVGEVPEMLPDRRYGRVIPSESAVALADAIESLLADIADGQFNPNLLIERHRSLYSDVKMAERMEEVYVQVLLNHPAADRPARRIALPVGGQAETRTSSAGDQYCPLV